MSEPFNPSALWVVMARRGLKPHELAKKLGKQTSKINRYLLGINEPSQQDLERISCILDWPLGFFTRASVEVADIPMLAGRT